MAQATQTKDPDAVAAEPAAAPDRQPDHLDDCPAERIESYTTLRPRDRQFMKTTRCIDCGAQRVDATGRYDQKKETAE